MKKISLILLLCASFFNSRAQTQIGPVEQKFTDALCGSLNQLDMSKINSSKEADQAFMQCFMAHSDMFSALADEKKVSMEDQQAMHDLGVGIGKNLLNEKCDGFLKLAVKMADKSSDNENAESSTTEGAFKRVDNKGFNYIVITDDTGNEKSFLWLRQFPGSENFMNGTGKYIGKKLKISWLEMEVYLPAANGYYNVKEITGIGVL
jgi:hypothetical protein